MPNPARIAATVAAIDSIGAGGPVSTSTLMAHGLTRAQLKSAAARDAVIQIQHGIWLTRSALDGAASGDEHLLLAVQAALVAFPGCAVSHWTAGQLHGLPLPPGGEWERRPWFVSQDTPFGMWPAVHLTRIKGRSIASRSRTPWIHVHGGHQKVTPIMCRGVPSTDVLTTAIDLGCETSARWALAIMDAAVRHSLGPNIGLQPVRREVLATLRLHVRRPGIRRVRRIVPFINPAAESALESISRWQMHRGRIPAPAINVEVRGADGRTYRADFSWEAHGVLGEADGLGKYADVQDLRAEKRRQIALEQAGWRVVRWGWDEAVWQPRLLIALLRQALAMPPRQ